MKDETYNAEDWNGNVSWTNYETWLAYVNLSNDESTYWTCRGIAAPEGIHDFFVEVSDFMPSHDFDSWKISDFNEVNYNEIYEAFNEE